MKVWNSHNAIPREPQPNPEFPGTFLYREDDVKTPPPEFDVNTSICQWNGSVWRIKNKPETETVDGVEVEVDKVENPPALTAIAQLWGERQQRFQEMEVYGAGLQDRPFTQAELDYRQELRDLPENSTPSLDDNGGLIGVTWPTKP